MTVHSTPVRVSCTVTVIQNVSVGDGGKAIVGNVTQHARVIVSDKNPASAARNAPKDSGCRRRRDSAEAKREAQA
jgi:hypothetical protein